MNKDKLIHVRVTKEMNDRVSILANKQETTKSEIIRMFIDRELKKLNQ